MLCGFSVWRENGPMDPNIWTSPETSSAGTFWIGIIFIGVTFLLAAYLSNDARRKLREWGRIAGGLLVIVSVIWFVVDVLTLLFKAH